MITIYVVIEERDYCNPIDNEPEKVPICWFPTEREAKAKVEELKAERHTLLAQRSMPIIPICTWGYEEVPSG